VLIALIAWHHSTRMPDQRMLLLHPPARTYSQKE